jgi:hypothetical protein
MPFGRDGALRCPQTPQRGVPYLVILSEAQRSRRIPPRYRKGFITGFLDFARNDYSWGIHPCAFV